MGKTFRRNDDEYNDSDKIERTYRRIKRFEKTYKGQGEIMEYITGERKHITIIVEE